MKVRHIFANKYEIVPEVENTSGITPLGNKVLILPDPVEVKSAGGIIIATQEQEKRERMAQIEATIIAVGSSCWFDEPEQLAQPGDHVIVAKYAGLIYTEKQTLDGKTYHLINDRDVVALKTRK